MPEVNQSSPVRGSLGKRKPLVTNVSDSDTLQGAYKRLFLTRDGKAVLEDLHKQFYDNPMDGDDLNREAGRRDVVHFIKRKLTP